MPGPTPEGLRGWCTGSRQDKAKTQAAMTVSHDTQACSHPPQPGGSQAEPVCFPKRMSEQSDLNCVQRLELTSDRKKSLWAGSLWGLGGVGRGPGNGLSAAEWDLPMTCFRRGRFPAVRQCYSSVALLRLIFHASVFLSVKWNDSPRKENMLCFQEAFWLRT